MTFSTALVISLLYSLPKRFAVYIWLKPRLQIKNSSKQQDGQNFTQLRPPTPSIEKWGHFTLYLPYVHATKCGLSTDYPPTSSGPSRYWVPHPTENSNFVDYLVQVNLCQKLFFLQNMGRTCCVQKLFWISETIYAHKMFFPGLSLEFSCIDL